jgi:hypothetical protein
VALAKPNPNATPRPGTGAAEIKPKPKTLPLPLADKTLAGKQQPKISSSIQTPGPKRAAPKSAKKAISVYTPAPKAKAPTNDDTEVEFSHPRPPGKLVPPEKLSVKLIKKHLMIWSLEERTSILDWKNWTWRNTQISPNRAGCLSHCLSCQLVSYRLTVALRDRRRKLMSR